MKIHNLNKLPDGFDSSWYDSLAELEEYDLRDLKKQGIDEIWYWYVVGSYEGAGQLLMRKGNDYGIHDMGHCSCYGPVDESCFIAQYKSLTEIESKCSATAWKEIKGLVEMAMEGGDAD